MRVSEGAGVNRVCLVAEAFMSHSRGLHANANQGEGNDGRRRQLRALLLSAADAACESRRIPEIAGRIARPVGQAVRDRISMLISAAS